MKTFRMRAVVLAGGLVVGLMGGAPRRSLAQTAAVPPATVAAEQAIRASADQFAAAFNRGDAKALAALWTADGDFVDETGELTTGRAAIEAKYAAYFAAEPDAKIAISVEAVRLVGADAAVEDGSAVVTLARQAAPVTGRYTVVHAKRDGKWQMANVREFPADAAAAGDPLEDLAWMVGAWRAEHLGIEFEIDVRWLPNNSFVEATYSRIDGEERTPTATQIIGVNPGTGRLMSWMFNGDGGVATGDWTPSDAGWSIAYEGLTNDGVPSTAVNWLFRVHDALVWQSTNRQLDGEPLPDTEEVVLKRK